MTGPTFPSALINEPGANSTAGVGPLERLFGTWTSPRENNCQGYNVMPLPQQGKIIEKDFLYYEELTFTSPGIAPNRGGAIQQDCAALTYEQRVYFGQGPAANTLVHFENGLFINATFAEQGRGAYGTSGAPGSITPPNGYDFPIIKQVSIPHGNSIVAVGKNSTFAGKPPITAPKLTTPPFDNPNVPNPNQALIDRNENLMKDGAVFGDDGIMLHVSSKNGPGAGVKNINFEQAHVRVTDYEMTIWLVTVRKGRQSAPQLQYTQTIFMDIYLDGPSGSPTKTLHIDANSLMPKNSYITSADLSSSHYPVYLAE